MLAGYHQDEIRQFIPREMRQSRRPQGKTHHLQVRSKLTDRYEPIFWCQAPSVFARYF